MPAASAAVIYFIRSAVISHLTEPGQRQLLCALATASSHAIAPPVITAAMEGCGVLLELLGAPAGTEVSVVCCAAVCSYGPGAFVLMLAASRLQPVLCSACAWPELRLRRVCAMRHTGEIHDEAAIKAVQNAATSKLSASSTVRKHAGMWFPRA